MLARLTVSNLAIVEKAEAEFAPGLNVLTGETGAGKSVLMGALELVLGGRADPSIVREGAKEARVEAEFALEGARAAAAGEALGELGVDFDGTTVVVRRAVSAAGGGRVWVNDSSATVGALKRLGRVLVDIHGPRANQHILEEPFQRDALDAFAGCDTSAYAKAWAALQDARARLADMEGEGPAEDEIEMLRYQVDELEAAGLSPDDDDIAARQAAAAHAGEIVEAANGITEALGGDEGAAETLSRLMPSFAAMAKSLPAAEQWAAEAEELTVRIQELSRSVADAASAVDADPETLAALDERLAVVNRLKRKYLPRAAPDDGAGDAERLTAELERRRARLAELEGRGERAEAVRTEIKTLEAGVAKCGAVVSKKRRSAAEKLSREVTAELRDLGFLQARFSVAVSPCEPGPHGCDQVVYMFEPNPGEPGRPLAATASSGETARVMLALKAVLSAHDSTDVLVFDEIDANIGGEVGCVVGAKMRAVARDHQVIAITHLPQSAACGDRHLVVSKSVSGGRTRTKIAAVEGEARVREIARMLGGEKSTSVVMRHAGELLSARGGR